MNRRKFLKFFGIGTGAAIVASTSLLPKPEPLVKEVTKPTIRPIANGEGILSQINQEREYVLYTGIKGKEAFEQVIADMFK